MKMLLPQPCSTGRVEAALKGPYEEKRFRNRGCCQLVGAGGTAPKFPARGIQAGDPPPHFLRLIHMCQTLGGVVLIFLPEKGFWVSKVKFLKIYLHSFVFPV